MFFALIFTHKWLKFPLTLHCFSTVSCTRLFPSCAITLLFLRMYDYISIYYFDLRRKLSICWYAYIIFCLQGNLELIFFKDKFYSWIRPTKVLISVWRGEHRRLLELLLGRQLKKISTPLARSSIWAFGIILRLFCWQLVSLCGCSQFSLGFPDHSEVFTSFATQGTLMVTSLWIWCPGNAGVLEISHYSAMLQSARK